VNIDISQSVIELLGGAPSLARDWSGPHVTYVRHSHEVGVRQNGTYKFVNVLVQPAKPQAKAFADALCELLAARVSLESKQEENYGTGSPDAEEVYNRAADKLWGVLQGEFE
jgi:hypothetical protein